MSGAAPRRQSGGAAAEAAPAIAYCANVAPAPTLAAARVGITRELAQARRAAGLGAIGVGLWIPDSVARELAPTVALTATARAEIRAWRDELGASGIHVIGFNGFPFGAFHAERVRHDVYRPDWTTDERAAYTRRLALILCELAPAGGEALSVTTVPLGWGAWLDDAALDACARRLAEMAIWLSQREQETGRRMCVDLEPEPGCALQRAADVVAFMRDRLMPIGPAQLIRRHIRVCHDICHAAALFESQSATVAAYRDAGIEVGRVQVSSIPTATFSGEALADAETRRALQGLVEPRYLHQTAIRTPDGETRWYEDLPDALRDTPAGPSEWRTHFHVPIHLAEIGPLRTTCDDIGACLDALHADDREPILEIETYAWQVAPAAARGGSLAESIAAEVTWLRREIERVSR